MALGDKMQEIHVVARVNGSSGSFVHIESTESSPLLRPSTYKVRKPVTDTLVLIVWWPERIASELMDAHSERFALQMKASLEQNH